MSHHVDAEKSDLIPLEEQPVLLNREPNLKPLTKFLKILTLEKQSNIYEVENCKVATEGGSLAWPCGDIA